MSTSTHREWRASNSSELGSALAEVRRTQGATQADIAEQIGVDRTYVARMESGLSTRQMQRIFAILRDAGFELAIVERDCG
ncbi:MAG: helix-turn-helix transcriptional regulator [Acidimicrobiales bacterium]